MKEREDLDTEGRSEGNMTGDADSDVSLSLLHAALLRVVTAHRMILFGHLLLPVSRSVYLVHQYSVWRAFELTKGILVRTGTKTC